MSDLYIDGTLFETRFQSLVGGAPQEQGKGAEGHGFRSEAKKLCKQELENE